MLWLWAARLSPLGAGARRDDVVLGWHGIGSSRAGWQVSCLFICCPLRAPECPIAVGCLAALTCLHHTMRMRAPSIATHFYNRMGNISDWRS